MMRGCAWSHEYAPEIAITRIIIVTRITAVLRFMFIPSELALDEKWLPL